MGIVTGAVVLLILAATATIGLSAFFAGQKAVDSLWRDLATSLADRTTQQVMRFLDTAPPWAALSDAACATASSAPTAPRR